MSDTFLIWSNQHGMWWRPSERGYTPHIEEAGRYPRVVADAIINNATVGGQLSIQRTDPVTGREYRQFTEVIVPAPDTDAADDGTCSCESYDCQGQCCGIGRCTCSPHFGIAVDGDNGAHVRFRVYAASNGHEHLGLAGQLVMRTAEFATFRGVLEPVLVDRPDAKAVTSR